MKKGGGTFDYYMNKEIGRAVLKLVLLKKIGEGKRYSYSFVKELRKSPLSKFIKKDSDGIKNDIYNTLKSLENTNYIKVNAKIENGKIKKYFSLTRKGASVLSDAKKIFFKYMQEVSKIME